MYDKPTASIILSGRKLKSSSLRSGIRWGCPLSTLLFNIVLKVLATAIREEKGLQIGKEEVKPSLFANDMTLYIKDSKMLPENYSCVLSHFSHVQLFEPMNCSLSGSSLRGILQARILEWVAFSFSKGSSQPRDWTRVSHVSCIVRCVLTTSKSPGKEKTTRTQQWIW